MARNSLKKGSAISTSVSVLLLTILFAAFTSERGGVGNAAEGEYRLVEKWAKVPAGEQFGGVPWTAFDSKGILYAFRRTRSEDVKVAGSVWMFDPNGTFIREWARGVAKEAHALRIDREGFIWITDSEGHQVKKYRPDGTLVMTLGKYEVAGNGADTFDQPTDVAVAPNGDFFVADGYGNQRVVKFNRDGKFIQAWGTKGTGPGQFRIPHTIVLDSRGRLIVGDRCGLNATKCTDHRIQIFDSNGRFLEEWTHLGGPYGMYITSNDVLYIGDDQNYKIWIVNARDGKLLSAIEGAHAHSVSVDPAGNVYAASNSAQYAVQKFAKIP